MAKRILTPEEKKLWRQVTRHDKKLRPEERLEPEEAPEPKLKSHIKKSIQPAAIQVKKEIAITSAPDAQTLKRLKKGEYPIVAKLDLHGLTLAEAHTVLLPFISAHFAAKSRCLLVIVGKGTGVLREALPKWLSSPPLASMIMAAAPAIAKHGGSGAFYVLLRKNK